METRHSICLMRYFSTGFTGRPSPAFGSLRCTDEKLKSILAGGSCATLPGMPLILILIVLILVFGGGGYYMGPGVGYYGGGGIDLILIVVLLFLLLGRGRRGL